jgi:hypothetical protein
LQVQRQQRQHGGLRAGHESVQRQQELSEDGHAWISNHLAGRIWKGLHPKQVQSGNGHNILEVSTTHGQARYIFLIFHFLINPFTFNLINFYYFFLFHS